MTLTTVLALIVAAYLSIKIWWALVFIVFIVLLVIDWLQTVTIAKNPNRWSETNRFLGEHPTLTRVHCWFGFWLIASVILLPYAAWLFIVGIGIEAYYVHHNHKLGIPLAGIDSGLLK